MTQKRAKIDENDFAALDKFARSLTIENTRPLSAAMRKRWENAKGTGPGRPRKPSASKSVPTLITVEPKLLKQIDAYAKKAGMSRSQLFAESVKQRIGIAG